MAEWRRQAARVRVPLWPMRATWLENWRTTQGEGKLLDVSAGGFAASMAEVPPVGRLLHASLSLAPHDVQADARVCGHSPCIVPARQVVHFAIETIHPADERQLLTALREIDGTPYP